MSNSNGYFVGNYVGDVRDLMVASLLTGQNSVVLGAPGWGKTDMGLSTLLHSIPDLFSFVRIEPSTLPQEIKGGIDVPAYLETGEFITKTEGSAFDPKWKAVLVDEFGRVNRVTAGTLMFLMDRKDVVYPAPVIATSNFMPSSPEAEALLDRFALWYWITPTAQDVRVMTIAQMQAKANANGLPKMPGKLPTLAEIEFVRNATPGASAMAAVADVIANVAGEIAAEGHGIVHPRRNNQWWKTLYYYSVWLTGDPNFSTVPAEAVKMLRFAHPAKTAEEYGEWARIVVGMGDPVGAAIEGEYVNVLAELNKFAGLDAAQRTTAITDAYTAMTKAQQSLESLKAAHPDSRLQQAIEQITSWFSVASQGKRIER